MHVTPVWKRSSAITVSMLPQHSHCTLKKNKRVAPAAYIFWQRRRSIKAILGGFQLLWAQPHTQPRMEMGQRGKPAKARQGQAGAPHHRGRQSLPACRRVKMEMGAGGKPAEAGQDQTACLQHRGRDLVMEGTPTGTGLVMAFVVVVVFCFALLLGILFFASLRLFCLFVSFFLQVGWLFWLAWCLFCFLLILFCFLVVVSPFFILLLTLLMVCLFCFLLSLLLFVCFVFY